MVTTTKRLTLTLPELERALDLGRLGPLWVIETDLHLERVGLVTGPIRSQEPFNIISLAEHWEKQQDKFAERHESLDPKIRMINTWDQWIARFGALAHPARNWHQQLFDRMGKVHRRWWAKNETETFDEWFTQEKARWEARGVTFARL